MGPLLRKYRQRKSQAYSEEAVNKILLYLLIGCAALAAQTYQPSGRQPDSVEHILQERYHIALTEEGLLGALQRGPSEVRGLAAISLADHGYKDAIGAIMDALSTETLQGAKIGLAVAAGQLGSEQGLSALKGMCGDRSWQPGLRMYAADSMLGFAGREDCLSDVLDVLRSGDPTPEDRQGVLQALSLLKRFKHITAGQLDEIRELSASYLKSQAPELRTAAGQCVRDVGGPWAISQLRAAIDAERDESVRVSLRQDLGSIGQ